MHNILQKQPQTARRKKTVCLKGNVIQVVSISWSKVLNKQFIFM